MNIDKHFAEHAVAWSDEELSYGKHVMRRFIEDRKVSSLTLLKEKDSPLIEYETAKYIIDAVYHSLPNITDTIGDPVSLDTLYKDGSVLFELPDTL